MDRSHLNSIVQEAVRRLLEEKNLSKIILFGSVAKNLQTKDSDLDFLIVKKNVVSQASEMRTLRRSLRGLGIPIDLIVVSEEDFKEKLKQPSNIYYWANKEGKVLYEGLS